MNLFDWIIIDGASTETNRNEYISRVLESKNDNIIFLDGADAPLIPFNYLKKSKLIFKREKIVKNKFDAYTRFFYLKLMKRFYFKTPESPIQNKHPSRVYMPPLPLENSIKLI